MNALPNRLPPRISYRDLPSAPDPDDPELVTLMGVVSRLPEEGRMEMLRGMLLSALAFDRTGDPEFLSSHAEAALVTMRIRRDPEDEKALNAARYLQPAAPGHTVDVEEMLARRGL
jgi:hypothetical protein